jgi:hypothetical protein
MAEGELPLAAIAAIWKRERRTLTACFGGSSMRPTLPPGAELTFVCGAPVAAGDVAVMLHRGRVLVHRVVACSPRGFLLTRGDGTWLLDPPIAAEDALGPVVGVRQGDRVVEPPPPPSSAWRRVTAALVLELLETSAPVGRGLIAGLWAARYGLWLVPNALLRRGSRDRPTSIRDEREGPTPAA